MGCVPPCRLVKKLPAFWSVMPPSSGLSSPRIKNSWIYSMKGLVLIGGMTVKVHASVTLVPDHLHARALTSLERSPRFYWKESRCGPGLSGRDSEI
jgi:hypothetical protein